MHTVIHAILSDLLTAGRILDYAAMWLAGAWVVSTVGLGGRERR